MKLIPYDSNEMFGRDKFRIHGDNRKGDRSASEGCIVMGPNIRSKIANSNDKTLVVIP